MELRARLLLVDRYTQDGRSDEARRVANELLARFPEMTAQQGVSRMASVVRPGFDRDRALSHLREAGFP